MIFISGEVVEEIWNWPLLGVCPCSLVCLPWPRGPNRGQQSRHSDQIPHPDHLPKMPHLFAKHGDNKYEVPMFLRIWLRSSLSYLSSTRSRKQSNFPEAVFDGRIIITDEMRLYELDGQRWLSNATATNDYQLILLVNILVFGHFYSLSTGKLLGCDEIPSHPLTSLTPSELNRPHLKCRPSAPQTPQTKQTGDDWWELTVRELSSESMTESVTTIKLAPPSPLAEYQLSSLLTVFPEGEGGGERGVGRVCL